MINPSRLLKKKNPSLFIYFFLFSFLFSFLLSSSSFVRTEQGTVVPLLLRPNPMEVSSERRVGVQVSGWRSHGTMFGCLPARDSIEKIKEQACRNRGFRFRDFLKKKNSNKSTKILVYNQKEIEERITLLFVEFLGYEIASKSLQSESK